MKPHEETWEIDERRGAGRVWADSEGFATAFIVPEDDTVEREDGRIVEVHSPTAMARRQLAAQAPAMARLLLKIASGVHPLGSPERDAHGLLKAAGVLP